MHALQQKPTPWPLYDRLTSLSTGSPETGHLLLITLGAACAVVVVALDDLLSLQPASIATPAVSITAVNIRTLLVLMRRLLKGPWIGPPKTPLTGYHQDRSPALAGLRRLISA